MGKPTRAPTIRDQTTVPSLKFIISRRQDWNLLSYPCSFGVRTTGQCVWWPWREREKLFWVLRAVISAAQRKPGGKGAGGQTTGFPHPISVYPSAKGVSTSHLTGGMLAVKTPPQSRPSGARGSDLPLSFCLLSEQVEWGWGEHGDFNLQGTPADD